MASNPLRNSGLIVVLRQAEDESILDSKAIRVKPWEPTLSIDVIRPQSAATDRWPPLNLVYATERAPMSVSGGTVWKMVYDTQTQSVVADAPLAIHRVPPAWPARLLDGALRAKKGTDHGDGHVLTYRDVGEGTVVATSERSREEKVVVAFAAKPYLRFLNLDQVENLVAHRPIFVRAQDVLAGGWRGIRPSAAPDVPAEPAARIAFYLQMAREPGRCRPALEAIAETRVVPDEAVRPLVGFILTNDLLEAPYSDKWGTCRFDALDILRNLGPRAGQAAPALRELVAREHDYVQRRAASVLERVTGDRETLFSVLSEQMAIEELKAFPPERTLPLLRKALEGSNRALMAEAVDALLAMGTASRQALPEIRRLAASRHFAERAVALRYYAGTQSDEFGPDMARFLDDPDEGVREAAFAALSKLGLPALPSMLAIARDPRSEKRWEALWAVNRMGPAAHAALPALIDLLDDRDLRVRQDAAAAIATIGKDALPVQRLLRFQSSASVQEPDRTRLVLEIMLAGGRLGSEAQVFLRQQLASPHAAHRIIASKIVGQQGPEFVVK